jgi:hypothetical protein
MNRLFIVVALIVFGMRAASYAQPNALPSPIGQAMIAGEAEDFIDPTFYNELEKNGFFKSISR